MSAISAHFFDGAQPLAHAVQLTLTDDALVLAGAGFDASYEKRALKVSPRIASAPRFIALPDFAQLECADAPWLDTLPQEESTEGPVAWLEQRWWAALGALTLTGVFLALGYFFALDAVTDQIAQAIPESRERAFGDRSVASLGNFLAPTSLDARDTRGIETGFAEFKTLVPNGAAFTLEFRDAPVLGPNAFTFPGGRIIVTDQLVKIMRGDDEVLAVIAHELGHAHYRHVLREAVRSASTAVLGGTLLGDASSMAGGLSTAMMLMDLRFSRAFEAQADAYATDLLHRSGRSPELFARSLVFLEEDQKTRGYDNGYSFLSTHPATEDRIARARAAVRAFPLERAKSEAHPDSGPSEEDDDSADAGEEEDDRDE